MTSGEKIKKYRLMKGLTQKELGKKMGVSSAYVGQYENDDRMPKIPTLRKFAEALEVKIEDLIQDLPKIPPLPKETVMAYFNCHISDVEKHFDKLNREVRTKVVEYAADLSENPKYKK